MNKELPENPTDLLYGRCMHWRCLQTSCTPFYTPHFLDFSVISRRVGSLSRCEMGYHHETSILQSTLRDNKEKKAYSRCSIASLWNIERRRTLLRASQTDTQSFESRPARTDWKKKMRSKWFVLHKKIILSISKYIETPASYHSYKPMGYTNENEIWWNHNT